MDDRDKLDLHLVKVLRLVGGNPAHIERLVSRVSKDQTISASEAEEYIYRLVDEKYLAIAPYNFIIKGSRPFPSQLEEDGFYRFYSDCWNCGKIHERRLDINIVSIWWTCDSCFCKWSDKVN